ncbi:MAG: hypothetical protein QHH07_02650 [Sedimentisphaerales bacterium]|nr:hypothetical protein [Sedimentisphaerales bacterium]
MGKAERRRGLDAIVPGRDQDPREGNPDIPSFDLNKQVRAEDRKATASRRKGPRARQDGTPDQAQSSTYSPWQPSMTDQQLELIADIVSRDIQRLIQGERVFGP